LSNSPKVGASGKDQKAVRIHGGVAVAALQKIQSGVAAAALQKSKADAPYGFSFGSDSNRSQTAKHGEKARFSLKLSLAL